jgi:hypothetical protein
VVTAVAAPAALLPAAVVTAGVAAGVAAAATAGIPPSKADAAAGTAKTDKNLRFPILSTPPEIFPRPPNTA